MVVDHQDEEHEPDLWKPDYLNSADHLGHEEWSQISMEQDLEHSDMGRTWRLLCGIFFCWTDKAIIMRLIIVAVDGWLVETLGE